jgi:septum formation protein
VFSGRRTDQDHPLVLASGSPRRREILELLRVPHVVVKAATNEDVRPSESPNAYLERVVLAKLADARRAIDGDLAERASAVLVADTSVIDFRQASRR